MGSRLTHWSERISIINIAAVSCCCAAAKNILHTHTQTHAWGSSALCGLCSSSEFAASRAVSAVAAEAAAQCNWLLNYCQLQLIIFLSFSDFLYIQTAGANAHVCAHMHTYVHMYVCMYIHIRMYAYICMNVTGKLWFHLPPHYLPLPSFSFSPFTFRMFHMLVNCQRQLTSIHIYLISLKQLYIYKLISDIIIDINRKTTNASGKHRKRKRERESWAHLQAYLTSMRASPDNRTGLATKSARKDRYSYSRKQAN